MYVRGSMYIPGSKDVEEEINTVHTWREKTTGMVIQEQWLDADRQLHRLGGPAYFYRDPKTGVVCEEAWCVHGKNHRDDGPALIRRNAQTGKMTWSQHYRDGMKMPPPPRLGSKVKATRVPPTP